MGKIAFLFPGQGSQSVGMGKDVYNNYQTAKNIFDKAKQVIGKDISKLCFEGTEDELKQTINSQPAIVTTSIAILEALKSRLDIQPHYVAGHSLGEYCAMYCAGVMSLENTMKCIQKRAELMNEVKAGKMVAIIRAKEEDLKEGLTRGSKIGYVDVANYNSPQQVVITGDNDAVNEVCKYIAKDNNAKIIPLAVSGAFHSKYVKNGADEFEKFIKNIELKDASIPVITNVDAEITTKHEDFRKKMPQQMYSSVHWTQTIQKMAENGVDTFIEIGNGKVLAGLNKRIIPDARVLNVFDKDSLEKTINELI
ncbi:MAG: ACP S-malonyltransferase [bacterium]|nr:ACP S-malonyltransferase [bacterium]